MTRESFKAFVGKPHFEAMRITNIAAGKSGRILILDGQPRGESYQFYLEYDDKSGEWIQEGDFIERIELEARP